MNNSKDTQTKAQFAGDPTEAFKATGMGNMLEGIKQDASKGSRRETEGPIAKAIESQTAKIPSDTFLWLAFGSIAVSATLQMLGQKERSTFVGQWAPTFLVLGLYNKMVKLLGSETKKQSSSR